MGTETPRLTHQSLKLLRAFAEDPNGEFAGSMMMKATGLSSGTLYPILMRFEVAGILQSRWEEGSAEELGRPRRRFYQLTPSGRVAVYHALRELDIPTGALVLAGGQL
jgi:DNA-binding PadR family transcriptional regulator